MAANALEILLKIKSDLKGVDEAVQSLRGAQTQARGFTSSLNVAPVQGFASALKVGLGAAALGAAAFIGIELTQAVQRFAASIPGGVKAALDLGGGLIDLQAQTGVSIDKLVVLQQAFTNAGLGADQVGPAINRLQKAMSGVNEEGEPTNKAFEKLRLNISDLQKLSPDQQLLAVQKAFTAIQNPAQRASIAMELFGKTGAKMLSIFGDSTAFQVAQEQVGRQALLLRQNAALFDTISDAIGSYRIKVQGFFVGIASGLTQQLLPLAEAFNKLDFAELGQRVGAYLGELYQTLKPVLALMLDFIPTGLQFIQTAASVAGSAASAISKVVEGLRSFMEGAFLGMLRLSEQFHRLIGDTATADRIAQQANTAQQKFADEKAAREKEAPPVPAQDQASPNKGAVSSAELGRQALEQYAKDDEARKKLEEANLKTADRVGAAFERAADRTSGSFLQAAENVEDSVSSRQNLDRLAPKHEPIVESASSQEESDSGRGFKRVRSLGGFLSVPADFTPIINPFFFGSQKEPAIIRRESAPPPPRRDDTITVKPWEDLFKSISGKPQTSGGSILSALGTERASRPLGDAAETGGVQRQIADNTRQTAVTVAELVGVAKQLLRAQGTLA